MPEFGFLTIYVYHFHLSSLELIWGLENLKVGKKNHQIKEEISKTNEIVKMKIAIQFIGASWGIERSTI